MNRETEQRPGRPLPDEGLRINNVIFAVRDLAETSEQLLADYGFTSWPVPHPNGITMHLIYVGGTQFLELLGAHDRTTEEAKELAKVVEDGDRVLQWEVHTNDIDRCRCKRSKPSAHRPHLPL